MEFLEYLPVLSRVVQPSGTRYRYSKVWKKIPDNDIVSFAPLTFVRPWPEYLREGTLVRKLKDYPYGVVLLEAWRLRTDGPGWEALYDGQVTIQSVKRVVLI